MNIKFQLGRPVARWAEAAAPAARHRLFRVAALGAALCLPAVGQAADFNFGPFSVTGFAKIEAIRGSNHCPDCQLFPNESRQRIWADELVPGAAIETTTTTTTLFQPYLGAKFDLGGGFTAYGLLSQRLRNGEVDIPGYLFEGNVAIGHDEYGTFRVGAMTTRGWSLADFPYGTDIGLSYEWGSSGAGYGLLDFRSARYTSRPFDVFEGDLVLEVTYSAGNTGFTINKPMFWEIWAAHFREGFRVDFVWQETHNGTPSSWGQGPFTGLTYNSADDSKLGSSGQGIALLMARYDIAPGWEVSGGIRRNQWSGAYAVQTVPDAAGVPGQWNDMFNVDWGGTRNGVPNPGYSANSIDYMVGLRYRFGKWIASTGMAYLGKANTDNPSERGQSNSALFNTIGLQYDFGSGLSVYGLAGMVNYGQLGLAPLSMPANAAFSQVDPRVSTRGNWFGLGANLVF